MARRSRWMELPCAIVFPVHGTRSDMKKRENLADVIKRLTHDFVEAVVHETEAAVAETRSSRATRVRRAPKPAARDARTPRARTTASPKLEKAASVANVERAKAQKTHKRVRKVVDVDATVVDPERLLAAIDHAQKTPEPPREPKAEAQEPAREEAAPPESQEQPKAAPAPRSPPLRENERAITTSSGAIVIRRSRHAA